MESEHTHRPDSHRLFVSSNYNVTTTSEVEWRFVAMPERPPEAGWPMETSGGACRRPMGLADLDELMGKHNQQLHAIHEPPLRVEETIGARLYTVCVRAGRRTCI